MQKTKQISAIFILFGFLFLILVPANLFAEVKPKISWKYYTVDLDGHEDIMERIMEEAPFHSSGRKAFGLTTWSITYDGKFLEKRNVCKIRDLEVSSTCDILLPKFEGGEPTLRRRLREFLHLIRNHELEHCRIATRHANALEQQLREIGQYPCSDIEEKVRVIYGDIMEVAKEAQEEFDRRTENGMQSMPFRKFSKT